VVCATILRVKCLHVCNTMITPLWHAQSDVVGPRRGSSAKDESMDYDVMSDQEWEPEAEDGEDIVVRRMPAMTGNNALYAAEFLLRDTEHQHWTTSRNPDDGTPAYNGLQFATSSY